MNPPLEHSKPSRPWPSIARILAGVGAALTLLAALATGVCYVYLESGSYPPIRSFRVDGPAYRAYWKAQQAKKGTYLILKMKPDGPGSEGFPVVELGSSFRPEDFVEVETRGIPLAIEKYIYAKYKILGPIVSHDGRADAADGYFLRHGLRRF